MKTLMVLITACLFACGSSNNGTTDAATKTDAAVVDAGTPDVSCFTNPTNNIEILNACTTAQQIFKDSHPPLLNADGSLPPLPGP